jgi:hypothetical protein
MSDEEFIAYLVLVRFDKGDDLRDRVSESLSALQDVLKEIGDVTPVLSSYDGSAVAYMLSTAADLQPWQITEQLQTPKSRRASPLKTLDKILVLSIGLGIAQRMDHINDWLRTHDSLA